ncbi:dihydrolipoyllysine-residue acetyltransferase [Glaciecola petra]|uniref:Dihydrolipoamide acetyltransferase component of pyruvate dehydrogenase complex n=1 Tax=Glaciecola petra TaxID=3075602 RepID=A0ABU2ZNZ0_9ALTE|nr:dihydrolipoyllysine-residue acetyltransferase [Aestuariibacter sp. P117]MDT0594343.1 dihydrolipoyllysine-residue acetyltransferase [Aestuariibacter sp. P117]
MSDFILPDIGEGIVECELLKWLVKEGEEIVEDQPVAEVMTDKATVEIPAMHNGVVGKLHYKEGDIAKVHQPLFSMQSIDSDNHMKNEAKALTKKSEKVQSNIPSAIEAFILPDIGEGIVECEIMQWHIQEGDNVAEDQVVVEVMTDKAVVEIPAKHNGKIVKIHYQKGDIAKVHTPLFDQYIDNLSNSDVNQHNSADVKTATVAIESDKLKYETETEVMPSNHYSQGENFDPPHAGSKNIASPAVRRLAREMNIALSKIKASGPKQRVLKQDVLLYANKTDARSTDAQKDETFIRDANTVENSPSVTKVVDRVMPLKGIQAAMAKQMIASVSTIPHFTVSDELCMDKLIALRSLLKPEFEKEGLSLSFMPFFIKALSLALHEYPILNSQLNTEATELTYLSAHNIGLAVDSKIGLLVPNIKNVQNLSLYQITVELNRLIDLARLGKLSNKDLSGGSISVSNIGALGGITATPVINKPEVAIVALGKIQKLPRFDSSDNVFASNIMSVNWSGDHRVIDGATMVKFNNLWLDYLSNPEKMLVHLR